MKFFDKSHCVVLPRRDDQIMMAPEHYTGKVAVLKTDSLNALCKKPEYQLFYVRQSMYGGLSGVNLSNGDMMDFFELSDVHGILDEQYLPDWAREILEAIRNPQPETGQIEMR